MFQLNATSIRSQEVKARNLPDHRSTTQDFVGGMSGCVFDIAILLCIDVKHTSTHANDETLGCWTVSFLFTAK